MAFQAISSVNRVELSAGRFDIANGSDAQTLVQTFSRIAGAQPKRLLLHFHGGLVGRESALESAQHLSPLYKSAGAESLFVIWETSPSEIMAQNVQQAVNEPIFQSILVRVTEFVKGKLEKGAGGKDVSELPKTMPYKIRDELEKGRAGGAMFSDTDFVIPTPEDVPDPEQALTTGQQEYIEDVINGDDEIQTQLEAILPSSAAAGSRSIAETGEQTTLMDPELLAALTPPQESTKSRSVLATFLLGKRVVTIVGAVIWRYANRRDHGLYLTVVEEILRAFYVRAAGRFLWTEMKDAVSKAFEDGEDRGGKALVDNLRTLWKSFKPCITLVGHSAGAIYVSRLLVELEKVMDPDFRVNVVLIAPACTFDYLAQALGNAGRRVGNLRIFGMSDSVELQDHLVPAIFPASLLYFVSGVLEDDRDEPLAGMERYYAPQRYGAQFQSIAGVKAFRALTGAHSYAWSQVAGFSGANCDMVTHGGWAGAPATLASVLYLIQGGCSNEW